MTGRAAGRRTRWWALLGAAATLTAAPAAYGVLVLGGDGSATQDPAPEGRSASPDAVVGAGVAEDLDDLLWSPADVLGSALDTCGSVAVMADPDRPLEVVVPAEDRVVVPRVDAPRGFGDEVDAARWTTAGGCVPTTSGPVVVVEAQRTTDDLGEPGPKLVAGFTDEGDQLWVREERPTVFGSYEGRGAFVLEDADRRRWTIVDARTGDTIAAGSPRRHQPTVPVTTELVGDLGGGLVRYPQSRQVGDIATAIAQVDDDRIIATDVDGIGVVRIDGLEREWGRHDLAPSVLWDEVADLSTGVAVLFDYRSGIRGVDLRTGKDRWKADVRRDDVNGLEMQVGSGVVVFRTSSGGEQVVLDSATGERLRPRGTVVADQDLLLLVAASGTRAVTVDELR
ncbi:hypothetical protein HNR19_001575 [Nocardioides thalensis]|uniref:PQQ-like domain-containing protein n=1 Tax=Nocardioides thalensis TaxID=1914755 RepID=A0A853C163_9ACTN|nr:hypothetical protein [Nocardioides thalensis]NYJ00877.1 hypothetical protein [Nocardioides thalensis]